MDQAAALAAYDRQVRQDRTPPIPGWVVEQVGPVLRQTAPDGDHTGAFIGWTDLGGLPDDEVDAVIAEQVAYFRSLGRSSEWKHYSHDLPADLSDRLVAAGLTREEDEAFVVGETTAVLDQLRGAPPPDGVRVRLAVVPDDLAEIAAQHELVWGGDYSWLVEDLAKEKASRPDDIEIFVAEDDATGAMMCAAWVRFQPGTDFAGLWGGTTHPDFRRRGAYRALVRARAELVAERGVRYLQVDAAPDSQPILARLGLVRLATTTPHVWQPAPETP